MDLVNSWSPGEATDYQVFSDTACLSVMGESCLWARVMASLAQGRGRVGQPLAPVTRSWHGISIQAAEAQWLLLSVTDQEGAGRFSVRKSRRPVDLGSQWSLGQPNLTKVYDNPETGEDCR